MEDRHNNTHPENTTCHKTRFIYGSWPFVVGVVFALIVGWWLFPKLMFTQHEQPVQFSHDTHLKNGLDCSVCHYLREDGTFSGIPTTEDCAVCHSHLLGKSQEERKYFDEYIRKNKEVKWLAYQKQPDNVFFSHAAHSLRSCNACHEFSEQELCMHCHIDVTKTKNPPEFKENRLSGYSSTTMKMWQCEECHANPNHLDSTNANNACFVCHK